MDSLHKPTFLTVSIPLEPRLLLFQFLLTFPPQLPSSFPSFYLVRGAFEQCFLSSVPLPLDGSDVWAFFTGLVTETQREDVSQQT